MNIMKYWERCENRAQEWLFPFDNYTIAVNKALKACLQKAFDVQ